MSAKVSSRDWTVPEEQWQSDVGRSWLGAFAMSRHGSRKCEGRKVEKEGGEWLRKVADVFGVKGWRKTRNGTYMVPYCTSLCVQSVSQSVSWFVSSANSTTLHESTAQYQSNFLFPFVFCLFTCTYFCLVNLLRITNVCRTVNRSLLETFQVNGMFVIEWERFRKHRKHT